MRFLIAGLGSIGRRHLRNLVALGERDVLLFRTHQATLPDADLADFPVETDLQKALATEPEAVIVSNPTALHLDVAQPVADAGCSLFMEKPLSVDCKGLAELSASMERYGAKTLVGFQFRFHPALMQIKRWIAEGTIGDVLSSSVYWGEYLPGFHPWEDYRKSYSSRRDLGGGVVRTLCHPIDYMRWLLGEVDAVSAFVGKVSDLEIEVEDLAEIRMQHNSGALTHIHLDYFSQPKQHDLKIVGTRGSITWSAVDEKANLYVNADKEWLSFAPADDFSRNSMFLAEMAHFLDVLKGNVPSRCTLQDGIRVQEIIAAVYESGIKDQVNITLGQGK